MKTMFSPVLVLTTVLATLPAQQPNPASTTTPAEVAFRDGWWAESGQGDLAAALTKYLAAAAADGPATVRGKALLSAGTVQQRLGKNESAIATFRQLLKDYPAAADLVEQARVHLRELTAVDLTVGYDEWYEKRLFTEEAQSQLLMKIESLAGLAVKLNGSPTNEERQLLQNSRHLTRSEILAAGKAAIPGLRKSAESKNEQLADAAVDLLFELGELPPTTALRWLPGWTYDPSHWRKLLQAGKRTPMAVEVDRSTQDRLVCAATQGPDALLEQVLAVHEENNEDLVGAAAVALMQNGEDVRQRLGKAMSDRKVPLRTRKAMQQALCAAELKPAFTAVEWLELGNEPLVFELRVRAVSMAAHLIGADDGELLDTMFERVESSPLSTRPQFQQEFAEGLLHNRSPLQVPWTRDRMRRFVVLSCRSSDSSSVTVTSVWRSDDLLRAMLAEALLQAPTVMRDVLLPPVGQATPDRSLAELLQWQEIEEPQAELLGGRWNHNLRDVLTAAWGGWSPDERTAALSVLSQAVQGSSEAKSLTACLRQIRDAASPEQQAQIDAVLQGLLH